MTVEKKVAVEGRWMTDTGEECCTHDGAWRVTDGGWRAEGDGG